MKSKCAMASLKQWIFDGQAEREKMSEVKTKKKQWSRIMSLLKFTQSFPFTVLDPGGQ